MTTVYLSCYHLLHSVERDTNLLYMMLYTYLLI